MSRNRLENAELLEGGQCIVHAADHRTQRFDIDIRCLLFVAKIYDLGHNLNLAGVRIGLIGPAGLVSVPNLKVLCDTGSKKPL
jgi:hypothetical protein